MGEKRGMKALEMWCKRVTEGYRGVKVENMTTSWRDGLAFCAMIHHFRPDLIDFESLDKENVLRNNELAFRIAEHQLGIPALLDAEDMVEYEVPDRLSILTYLSQFYQVFATQDSPRKSPSKRVSSDRVVKTPTSESPPSKVFARQVPAQQSRREPCTKCKLPVFIAERLLVEGRLFHRTCFRCARCKHQLSLANYYETEDGSYCCETCPDEEDALAKHRTSTPASTPVSDEVRRVDDGDNDEYSANFESLIESTRGSFRLPDPKELTISSSASRARASFFTHQLEDETFSDEDSVSFEPLNTTTESSDQQACVANASSKVPSHTREVSDTVSVPESDCTNKSDIFLKDNSVNVSKDTSSAKSEVESSFVDSESNKTSSVSVSGEKSKEPIKNIENINSNSSTKEVKSLVKSRLKMFDKGLIDNKGVVGSYSNRKSTQLHRKPAQVKDAENEKEVISNEDADGLKEDNETSKNIDQISEVTKEEKLEDSGDKSNSHLNAPTFISNAISPGEESVKLQAEISQSRSETSILTSTEDSIVQDEVKNVSVEEVDSKNVPVEEEVNSISVPSPTEAVSNSIEKHASVEYPQDMNPFGSDTSEPDPTASKQETKVSDETSTVERKKIKVTTNPFGSSDDDDDGQNQLASPPKPAARRSIPSESVEASPRRRIEAPRVSLNPFWSDGEEPASEEDESKTASSQASADTPRMPVPLPRSNKEFLPPKPSQPSPAPRKTLSKDGSAYGSASSLSSILSSGRGTAKKKRPAPAPPTARELFSEPTSATSSSPPSPTASSGPSPRGTPRPRKARPAPLPPSGITFSAAKQSLASESAPQANGNGVGVAGSKGECGSEAEPATTPVETQKNQKDVLNRSRQSHTGSISSTDNTELSPLSPRNKSTFGPWKRKKGPAPPRPIPQKRQIKQIPLKDVHQELQDIEVKQQELERQGVSLEQAIRDKFDEQGNEDTMPADVEDKVVQLFELVNEKNDLFRRQTELMYLKRQQRLEEEHAELEFQIRCLLERPEHLKTDTDKQREEDLIQRLVEVVERRNEIVECLEMDRLREAEEDQSIQMELGRFAAKQKCIDEEETKSQISVKSTKKKKKKEKEKKKKGKVFDADKDIDESEVPAPVEVEAAPKEKKNFKKWFK